MSCSSRSSEKFHRLRFDLLFFISSLKVHRETMGTVDTYDSDPHSCVKCADLLLDFSTTDLPTRLHNIQETIRIRRPDVQVMDLPAWLRWDTTLGIARKPSQHVYQRITHALMRKINKPPWKERLPRKTTGSSSWVLDQQSLKLRNIVFFSITAEMLQDNAKSGCLFCSLLVQCIARVLDLSANSSPNFILVAQKHMNDTIMFGFPKFEGPHLHPELGILEVNSLAEFDTYTYSGMFSIYSDLHGPSQ